MSQALPNIRVLIVDDSLFFRKKLESSLSEDPKIVVVGTVANALEAFEKINELKPDVITVDIEMPQMNGIDFIKKLIPVNPLPVVVVSSLPINALEALSAGAVDFVRKPQISSGDDLQVFFTELRSKIKIAHQAKVQRLAIATAAPGPTAGGKAKSSKSLDLMGAGAIKASSKTIICIGASTGGTEAIIQVIKDLPPITPGIIIVQHMPANFTNLYAQRLDRVCQMSAKEAEDMDRVIPGRILVAAGDYHLTLKQDAQGYFVRSKKGEKVNGHCPSVDVMFQSAAQVAGACCIGVILTGMGADGANGLVQLRQAGAYTIGQDQETCVVYGMPMEAYRRGGVVKQLPVQQIGAEILHQLSRTAGA